MRGRVFSFITLVNYFSAIFRRSRGVRFLIIGVANTLFGLLVFAMVIWLGGDSWMALLASNIAGIGWNFLTIGGTVFRDLTISHLPKFTLTYTIVYFVNLAGIHMLNAHVVDSRIVAQAVLVLPIALMTYLLLSWYVFSMTLGTEDYRC